VLEALERAVAAGSDPSLDALTQCTGCKCCGHEGGRKGSIKTHGRTGCAQCGTDTGCTLRAAGAPCQCAFHARQPERVLNRVVRRAALTPGFLDSCRWVAAPGLACWAHPAVIGRWVCLPALLLPACLSATRLAGGCCLVQYAAIGRMGPVMPCFAPAAPPPPARPRGPL